MFSKIVVMWIELKCGVQTKNRSILYEGYEDGMYLKIYTPYTERFTFNVLEHLTILIYLHQFLWIKYRKIIRGGD